MNTNTISVYDDKNNLKYKNIINYKICKNGWDEVKTSDNLYALYDGDKLIGNNIINYHIYNNGFYILYTEENVYLYNNNNEVIAKNFIDCYCFNNKWYSIKNYSYNFSSVLARETPSFRAGRDSASALADPLSLLFSLSYLWLLNLHRLKRIL